nr:hypothetical protein [Scopulibacillus darangshiensis]
MLLTKDGNFRSVRLKKSVDVMIGQTVLDMHLSQQPVFRNNFWLPAFAACLSIVLILGLPDGAYQNHAVAAYVSFDINPSIEASVDNNMHIVQVKPMNNDAREILKSGHQYKGMSLRKFTSLVITKLKNNGYFEDHPEVLVTTAVTSEIKADSQAAFQEKVEKAVNEFEDRPAFQNGKGSVNIVKTTVEKHNQARKKGLSTGKYLIYLNASDRDKHLTVDHAKKLSIKELQQQYVNNTTRKKTPANHDRPDKSDRGEGKVSKQSNSDQASQKHNVRNHAHKVKTHGNGKSPKINSHIPHNGKSMANQGNHSNHTFQKPSIHSEKKKHAVPKKDKPHHGGKIKERNYKQKDKQENKHGYKKPPKPE